MSPYEITDAPLLLCRFISSSNENNHQHGYIVTPQRDSAFTISNQQQATTVSPEKYK
jgi:hypothetical protein